MNAHAEMSCFGCGFARAWVLDGGGCPACGRRHFIITGGGSGVRIWRQVATLMLIRRGESLPNYRTAPLYGDTSRSSKVTSFALAEGL